jgi:heptosyltransferase-2
MFERLSVRLPNWLGDTVMAVPLLAGLRAAFPGARVLAAGPWASILAGQGLADVLLTYPRSWSGRLRSADVARDFRPEAALLLPNSLESALSAWYWGARRRIGYATGGRKWLLTDRVRVPSPRRHQIDEYLELGERIGVRAPTATPRLEPPMPDGDERREVRRRLAASGAPPGAIGIHLGAAYGDAKVWPGERVIELVAELRRRDLPAVLLGPIDDAGTASAIVRATGVPSLVGRDRPATLPALLTELGALVAGDTGVAHLAAALGTPAVTLFGPTDPALTAPRGPGVFVRHPVPCAPCFYRTCPIDHPCLRNITAAEVADRLMTLVCASRGLE